MRITIDCDAKEIAFLMLELLKRLDQERVANKSYDCITVGDILSKNIGVPSDSVCTGKAILD